MVQCVTVCLQILSETAITLAVMLKILLYDLNSYKCALCLQFEMQHTVMTARTSDKEKVIHMFIENILKKRLRLQSFIAQGVYQVKYTLK